MRRKAIRSENETIPAIEPFRDSRDLKTRGLFGRQVLQRVHGEIDFILEQGDLKLLGEKAWVFLFESVERRAAILIARAFYFDDDAPCPLGTRCSRTVRDCVIARALVRVPRRWGLAEFVFTFFCPGPVAFIGTPGDPLLR